MGRRGGHSFVRVDWVEGEGGLVDLGGLSYLGGLADLGGLAVLGDFIMEMDIWVSNLIIDYPKVF